jgi:hypothetical protein
MPLNSVGLAGAVRPDHRHQGAGLHLAAQVMHRRVAVVAERHVVEGKRRAHDQLAIAQKTAPHSSRDQHRHGRQPLQRREAQDRGRTVAGGCA